MQGYAWLIEYKIVPKDSIPKNCNMDYKVERQASPKCTLIYEDKAYSAEAKGVKQLWVKHFA